MAVSTPYTARVTLSSTTGDDVRMITLLDGRPVEIGRSSRSESKNLQSQADNALFDSAVISRRHAQLRVNGWALPDYQVWIRDLGSKHGTAVNGERLLPDVEHCLRSGDTIKLGGPITVGDKDHDGITLKFARAELTVDAPPSLEPVRDTSSTHHRSFRAPSYSSFVDYEGEDEDEDGVYSRSVEDKEDERENEALDDENDEDEDEDDDDDDDDDDDVDDGDNDDNGYSVFVKEEEEPEDDDNDYIEDEDSSVSLDDGDDDRQSTKSDEDHSFPVLKTLEQQTATASCTGQHATDMANTYQPRADSNPVTADLWPNSFYNQYFSSLRGKLVGVPVVRPSLWLDDSMRESIVDDKQLQSPPQLSIVDEVIAGTDQAVDGTSSLHPLSTLDSDNATPSVNLPKFTGTEHLNLPTTSQHDDSMIDVLLKQHYDPVRKLPDVASSQLPGTNACAQDDQMIRRMIPSFEKSPSMLNYSPNKPSEMFHPNDAWLKASVATFPSNNVYTESLAVTPGGHVCSSHSDANADPVGEAVEEATVESTPVETRPPPAPTPSKISIVDLVERQDNLKESVPAILPSPECAVVTSIESSGSKRKADVLDRKAVGETAPQISSKRQRTKAPRSPRMRSGLLKGAFIGAIGGAVGGAAGVVAFLNSSASQTLIDWLST